MDRLTSFVGMFALTALAVPFCTNLKAIKWRPVVWGLILQIVFAVLILGVPSLGIHFAPMRKIFDAFNSGFNALIDSTQAGSAFLFGRLVTDTKSFGFIFAFQVLPTIIFFSTLMAILYYLGVMQVIVRFFAVIMQKTMHTSGAETLSTSANIFVGQTEAPLMIRPYVGRMTESELFLVMVGGMANTAGGVMAAYVLLLRDRMPDIAGHLLTASIMSAPASIAISKIMVPETGEPETLGTSRIKEEVFPDTNIIDAAARGASEGLALAFNVGGMLLAFVSLIFMINAMLGWFGDIIGFANWGAGLVPAAIAPVDGHIKLSLDLILGWLFWPISFLMGVPTKECVVVGALLGQKTVLNEFVAYSTLANIGPQLSDRTMLIASYALCGFANFGSIAIQIGGIGGMAPNRRHDLARLGLRSIIGGTLCTCLLGAIAGFLI